MQLKVLFEHLPYTLKRKYISLSSKFGGNTFLTLPEGNISHEARFCSKTFLTLSRGNTFHPALDTVITPSLHSQEEIHLMQLKALLQHLPYTLEVKYIIFSSRYCSNTFLTLSRGNTFHPAQDTVTAPCLHSQHEKNVMKLKVQCKHLPYANKRKYISCTSRFCDSTLFTLSS